MAIQLDKNAQVSLSAISNGLRELTAGLGWDPASINGHSVDLDLSLFMMGSDGKLIRDEFFVFYNNPTSPDGAAFYPGDSRAGDGDGDDEQVLLNLTKLDPRVEYLYFAVTIDNAEERGHHFGHVKNAYIRILNTATGNVLCEYRLNEHFFEEDSLLIATMTKNEEAWDLQAVGQAFGGGLATLVEMYQ
ncbi:TerD family protein [Mucilaginibacter achroorhodeus]|uniref:TerD family protein n=1 Tax=Mucilaginibacter achroorhodeus TaxID=2599294 RepID=A0A563U616_9SPHI|nr:TerD family protein [Mucilaginibacter achroorhodeus]TWR26791.1 TerD family protein [Mucilaginibacter achroorhodeus]